MNSALSRACLVLCASIPAAADAQWSLVPSGVPDSLTAVVYEHGRFLTTGGNGAVLTSSNDGISFSTTGNYVPHFYHGGFNHIAFFDSLNGVGSITLAGDALQRTLDGGATWTQWDLGVAAEPWVQPLNDSDAVLFLAGPGLTFGTDGRFLIEQDFELYANIDSICNEIYTPGSCSEWVVDDDTLIETGGWGWVRLSSDRCATFDTASFHYAYYVYLCDHISADTLAYIDFNRELRISPDKGLTWSLPRDVPGMTGNYIWMGFDMLTATTGAVVGSEGAIHITSDAGANWSSPAPVTNEWLYDVHYVDAQHLFAVGEGGTILASQDAGATWQTELSGTTSDLKAIASSTAAVIVVGDDGVILRRDMSVGIDAPQVGDRLRVFPNPFSEQATVDLASFLDDDPARFDLLDASGRVVLSVVDPDPERLPLSVQALARGHYVACLTLGDGRMVRTPVMAF